MNYSFVSIQTCTLHFTRFTFFVPQSYSFFFLLKSLMSFVPLFGAVNNTFTFTGLQYVCTYYNVFLRDYKYSTSVFLYRHVRIKFSLTHALALLRFLLQTMYSWFYRRFMSELLSVLYYCHIYRL